MGRLSPTRTLRYIGHMNGTYRIQHGQAPNTNLAAYKVMALTRLLCPDVNIPSTTALATLNREDGYQLGLQRGANVLMVNLTPINIAASMRFIRPRPVLASSPTCSVNASKGPVSGFAGLQAKDPEARRIMKCAGR